MAPEKLTLILPASLIQEWLVMSAALTLAVVLVGLEGAEVSLAQPELPLVLGFGLEDGVEFVVRYHLVVLGLPEVVILISLTEA